MAIVVQKYGGSSVGDAEKIKNVARRIAAAREKGNEVVAVVSAMGDTTDELVELAYSVTDQPSEREFDVLLSTGEIVSSTLLAMALRLWATRLSASPAPRPESGPTPPTAGPASWG